MSTMFSNLVRTVKTGSISVVVHTVFEACEDDSFIPESTYDQCGNRCTSFSMHVTRRRNNLFIYLVLTFADIEK